MGCLVRWLCHIKSMHIPGWYQLICPWTKWPPFHRRHSHIHFNEWKLLSFYSTFREVCSQWSNWQFVSIGLGNGLVPSGNKPLPEPTMTHFTDAYIYNICGTRGGWVCVHDIFSYGDKSPLISGPNWIIAKKHLGPDSIKRCHLTSIGNPVAEIRRSYDRLISTMGFPIQVRRHLYIGSGPWMQWL